MAQFQKGKSGNPSGRPRGAKNKVSGDLREALSSFLNSEFKNVMECYKRLTPRDRLKFYIEVLPYVVPKLQNTSLGIEIERLPDEQLDELIQKLINQAKIISHEP